jgi:hypothetical protein
MSALLDEVRNLILKHFIFLCNGMLSLATVGFQKFKNLTVVFFGREGRGLNNNNNNNNNNFLFRKY